MSPYRVRPHWGFAGLCFLQKLGFQHHGAAASPAFNFAGAVGEADVFHHRTAFQRQGRTFYFEVFNKSDRVAFGEQGAVAVFYVHFR